MKTERRVQEPKSLQPRATILPGLGQGKNPGPAGEATVHLDIPEAPRKWTLQFCIPDSGKRQLDVSSGVIRIRPRKKVAPPFPREKKALRLEETSEPNPGRPSSVMVYATVDEEGALGNLKMVRGADPRTDNTILAHLRSWEFLPAFRGEEPILVEALFGIPLP